MTDFILIIAPPCVAICVLKGHLRMQGFRVSSHPQASRAAARVVFIIPWGHCVIAW
jgi:hypothetical protein